MIDNAVEWQAGLSLQGALPDRADAPARFGQGLMLPPVALDVRPDLVAPEVLAALRPAEQVAVMPVPETAVNEDHRAPAGEDKIGLAGQVLAVQPEAESAPVKRGADRQFGSGVLAFDSGHHPASDGAGNGVGRHYAFASDVSIISRCSAGVSLAA